ncbi:hypothetical protein TIFTF001_041589 [Ficus carica]|uniref:Uncharacterized protein n=1 Tax=Ficus carica TaxID=3494 RepID=A0AA88CQZ8_FICCA|nr:hypothetical protein TIFTF001_041587 [Ficus carica]GMN31418.1 hypothetical protein TIFTF001_041589 [Ficus carica]
MRNKKLLGRSWITWRKCLVNKLSRLRPMLSQANGAEIDAATQLVMVFQTLSNDFDLFQASYNLNRREMSLTELMKELQAFENIFKGSGSKADANLAERSSPAPNPKRKKEKGKNKGNKPAVKAPASKKSKKTKKRKEKQFSYL